MLWPTPEAGRGSQNLVTVSAFLALLPIVATLSRQNHYSSCLDLGFHSPVDLGLRTGGPLKPCALCAKKSRSSILSSWAEATAIRLEWGLHLNLLKHQGFNTNLCGK